MTRGRALILFEGAIKSQVTRDNYLFQLNKFLKFCKIKDADGLMQLKESALQTMIEDYILWLKQKMNPNSIPSCISPLELFFAMNDKGINFKKIKRLFPSKIKTTGNGAWTTKDIQKMLKSTTEKRTIALTHVLASTGCRHGAIEGLEIKHKTEMSNGCSALFFYADSKEEYYGFLTPEATNAINEYLEERRSAGEFLKEDSPLFRSKYVIGSAKTKRWETEISSQCLKKLIKNAGLKREKTGIRYNIQTVHGFRKRFNTILKLNSNINSNIAEKIMGHKNGLDGVYFVPTKDECFQEFQKAIFDLTIDDSERKNLKIEKLEKEKSETEKMKEKFELDHQFLQFVAHTFQSGVQFIKPDGKPYEIDPEVIKKIMKDYVEPFEMEIDESLAKLKADFNV